MVLFNYSTYAITDYYGGNYYGIDPTEFQLYDKLDETSGGVSVIEWGIGWVNATAPGCVYNSSGYATCKGDSIGIKGTIYGISATQTLTCEISGMTNTVGSNMDFLDILTSADVSLSIFRIYINDVEYKDDTAYQELYPNVNSNQWYKFVTTYWGDTDKVLYSLRFPSNDSELANSGNVTPPATGTPNKVYFRGADADAVINEANVSCWNETYADRPEFIDTQNPSFRNNKTNKTAPKTNEFVNLSITIEDNIGLGGYILSIKNNTANWENRTFIVKSGTSAEVYDEIKIINEGDDKFYWEWYFNDSSNNWNRTGVHELTISNDSADYYGGTYYGISPNKFQLYDKLDEISGNVEIIEWGSGWVDVAKVEWSATYSNGVADFSSTADKGEIGYPYNISTPTNASSVTCIINVNNTNIAGECLIIKMWQNGLSNPLLFITPYDSQYRVRIGDSYVNVCGNYSNNEWLNYVGTYWADTNKVQYLLVNSTTVICDTGNVTSAYGQTGVFDKLEIYNPATDKMYASNVSCWNGSYADNPVLFVEDITNPSWKYNKTNFTSIKVNQNGQFNITVEDDTALDTIILSFKNHTSAWENISTQRISGTSFDMAFNMTISITRGQIQYWKFYVNDTSGNWNETDLFQIVVSNTAPTMDEMIPDYSLHHNVGLSIKVNISDADSNSITCKINSTLVSINNATCTITDNPAQNEEGIYNILFSADDGTDNVTDAFNYQIINDAPTTPTGITPVNLTYKNTNYIVINWTASTDTESDTIIYYLDNETKNVYFGTGTGYNWTNLNEKNYQFRVKAGDGYENSSYTDLYNFTIDTTNPILIILNNTGIKYDINYNNISFTGTASDVHIDKVIVNDSSFTVYGTTNWHIDNNSAITSGRYNFNISVNDSAGNHYDNNTFYLTFSDINPSWKYNKTNFTTIRVNENGQFNITVEDDTALDTIILSFNNNSAGWENISTQRISGTSYDANFSMTISTTRGQTQYWKFYVNDTSGRWNETDLFQIIISDTLPTTPSTPVTTTNSGNLVNGNYTNVTITSSNGAGSTDADSDAIQYIYRFSDVEGVLQEGTTATLNCGTVSGCDRGDIISVFIIATTLSQTANSSASSSSGQTIISDLPPYFNQNISDDTINEDSGANVHTDITNFCTDIDGDSIIYSEVSTTPASSVTWSIDGNDVITHTTILNWNGTAITIVKCTANSLDSSNQAKYNIIVNNVNDPPTAPTDLSAETNRIVGQTITASCTDGADIDNDVVTHYVEFENNNDSSVIQGYSTDMTYVVQQSDAHDKIGIKCWSYDGALNSTTYDVLANNVSIDDSLPTQPSTPTTTTDGKGLVNGNYTNVTITTSAGTGSTDADGDTITYHYRWGDGTTLYEVAHPTLTMDCDVVSGCDRGDTITVQVIASTIYGNGTISSASGGTVISDLAPYWETLIDDDALNEDDSQTAHNDLTGYCNDIDSDSIVYSVQTENINQVDVSIDGDEVLQHTPAANWNGTSTVTIRCTANLLTDDDSYDIVVTSVDDYGLWSYNRTNFTEIKYNQNGAFNITFTDVDTIAGCLFSYNNDSSGWVNDTWIQYSGTTVNLTTIKTMEATYGETYEWRYYCNDTDNNMYNSTLNLIVISDTPPTTPDTPSITEATVYTNDTITSSAGTGSIDVDGDDFNYIYQFRDNDDITVLQEGTSLTFDCDTSGCDRGDTIYLRVLANSTSNSSYSTADSITISDLTPYWNQNITNDTLNEDDSQTNHVNINNYCTDIDDDAITYSIVQETATEVDVTLTGTQISHTPYLNWNGTSEVIFKCTANSLDDTNHAKYYVIVNSVDDYMTWSNNATNTTTYYVNNNVMFTSNVLDADTIAMCLFSHQPNTGQAWVNESAYSVNSDSIYNVTYNYTILSTQGQIFSWRFYCNDTDNNMYNSSINSFTISDTSPVWTTAIADDTILEDSGLNNHEDITTYCTDADSDTVTYNVQIEDTSKVDVELTVADLLTHTPASNWNGTTDVTIRCTANSITTDDTYTITVTSVDDYGIFTFNRTNFTEIKYNENGAFNVTFTDIDTIAGCLFSYNNDSSGWLNDTWIQYSGTTVNLTTTKQMTATYLETYEWRYYCNDSAGIMYNSTLNLIGIGNTAPAFTQTINDYSELHNNSLSIKVNATDVDSDFPLSFWVNETRLTMTNATSTITNNWIGNQNGTFHILVTAGDSIDNTTTKFDLTIIETSPQFTQLPNDYYYYHNSTFNLTINTTDGESDSITCKINETLLSITNETCQINGVLRSVNQSYNILISLDDGYYNNTDVFVLTVLNSAPYYISFSPSNLTIIGNNYVNLTVNANDSEGDLIIYEFYNGTSSAILNLIYSGTDHSYNLTNLEDKTYYWRVNISDGLDSNLSDIYQYNVNTVSPAINLIFPEDEQYLNYNYTKWGNFTDYDVNGLDTALFYLGWDTTWLKNQTLRNPINDGTTINNFTDTFHLNDGNYKYNVWSNDSLGNGDFYTTKNFTFIIDTTYPSIKITNPTEDTDYTSSNITITWTSSDTNWYKVFYSAYRWTSTGRVTSPYIANTSIAISGTTYETFSVSDYPYTFYIYVQDKALNTNFTYFNFTVSTIQPVTPPPEGGGGAPPPPPLEEIIEELIDICGNDICEPSENPWDCIDCRVDIFDPEILQRAWVVRLLGYLLVIWFVVANFISPYLEKKKKKKIRK